MGTKHKPGTQEMNVLEVLEKAREGKLAHYWITDGWVNKQYFIRVMYLTQAARALHNLEKMGHEIEHSVSRDEYGFKSYRIIPKETLF